MVSHFSFPCVARLLRTHFPLLSFCRLSIPSLMPPKKWRKAEAGESGDGATTLDARKVHAARRNEFVSAELHWRFERHVTNAQDAYLTGDSALAEKEATAALSIKPTPNLFALLSVIAESKGQFDRANDFRLLQAFLAHDATLWEELLHDFLSQQLYYKSVVCLQRISAMEKDPARYRSLQFQLADLLIGLGEIRRATHVLVPLWNSSKCRDFEVFALLSSLYFQLGKWSSLQRLITSSLKNSFHVSLPPELENSKAMTAGEAQTERNESAVATATTARAPGRTKTSKRVSKRVRFFGVDDDEEEEANNDDQEGEGKGSEDAQRPEPNLSSAAATGTSDVVGGDDDFSFDELEESLGGKSAVQSSGDGESGTLPRPATVEAAAAGAAVHGLYGDRIRLVTPTQKRNFLTLVNVHAELLNESGRFAETVQLMTFTAATLGVNLLDLPPDLLVRAGTAYAYLGEPEMKQPCREIFQHLLETCRMDEYGDVLLDAGHSLQKVGMHEEAQPLFETFSRYYEYVCTENAKRLAEAEREVVAAEKAATSGGSSKGAENDRSWVTTERLRLARQHVDELRAESAEMKTVLAAAYYGSANSLFSLRRIDDAEINGRKALAADPTHLHARLLLGKLYFYHRHDLRAAVDALTPKEGEPALQRIQLGASLVRVFFKSRRYVEAIALGVSIFEIVFASSEDGDTESVAPGSSRRATAPLLMPTMSRASSAIVPASTLLPSGDSGVGAGTAAASVGRLSAFLAASIRSGTSVYRQQLTRRGRAALTTTVYGASAAASIAAGWGREDEEARLKDSSTIFRFHRTRRAHSRYANGKDQDDGRETKGEREEEASPPSSPGGAEEDESAHLAERLERRRSERREVVTTMDAKGFWESPTDDENEGTDKGNVKTEDGKEGPWEAEAEPAEDKEEVRGEGDTTGMSTGGSGGRKRARRNDDWRAGRVAAITIPSEKDRSLEELEEFEEAVQQQQEEGEAARDADSALPLESYELPSLEEISKRFDDPVMAKLFLEASSHQSGIDSAADQQQQQGQRVSIQTGAGAGVGPLPGADRVTMREALTALGKMEFMSLTVAVVDSYSALGKFNEAKEFAYLALSRIGAQRFFRQMGTSLERPLRLALLRAAMAAGHSEDAFRVGLRLLQSDPSPEERQQVIELMHGVLNRCEDRTTILYRVFTEGACDVPLLVLFANRYYQTRSYTRVLNLYLCALQERPRDVFLTFLVGLCYLFVSHQKTAKPREALVSAGVYYLSQYQSLLITVDSSRTGEALYNSARAMHFLRLHHLCVPLYQRVAYDLPVPEKSSLAVQRAARVNLYYIYSWESRNRQLALSALPHVTGVQTLPTKGGE